MNPATSTALSLAALVGGYFLLLGRTHLNEIRDSHQAMDASYSIAQSAEEGMLRLENLRREAGELSAMRDELWDSLSLEASRQAVWIRVSSLLEDHGLQVDRADVIESSHDALKPWVRLRVDAKGAFVRLYDALVAMENARPPLRVIGLHLRAADRAMVVAELELLGHRRPK